MIVALFVLMVLLGAFGFLVQNLGVVWRDLSETVRASVTGGRLSEGPWSNLAVASLWLLLFLVGVM
ncbi:MAG: hypothetical protein ACPG7W_01540 [Paracoccaceae bacterium]